MGEKSGAVTPSECELLPECLKEEFEGLEGLKNELASLCKAGGTPRKYSMRRC